jgi:hypothetical protein
MPCRGEETFFIVEKKKEIIFACSRMRLLFAFSFAGSHLLSAMKLVTIFFQFFCFKLFVVESHSRMKNFFSYYFISFKLTIKSESRLPDSSWYNIPKCETIPNNLKMARWPQRTPNDSKIDQMAIKYTNIFHCKTLQNWPKLLFLVWKYAIWQPGPECSLKKNWRLAHTQW